MNTHSVARVIHRSQSLALLGLPMLWLLMFALHFHSITEFFVWRPRYIPVPAADKVTRLIALHNHWPMIHDPHLIGYLTLPVLVLAAFGLYALGREIRPAAAALALSLTMVGSLYVAGVFGLFTALTRGLGDVDARDTDGAIATYAAVTADHGAYGLTRKLAELALIGIALQASALWRAPRIPRGYPGLMAFGCALFLAFWDVDNMMFAGAVCLFVGASPMSRELWRRGDP